MDELDPLARQVLPLAPGERLVDCWAASRQGYAREHSYLVLTSDRVLYLLSDGVFRKSWKLMVNAPLASIEEPSSTLGWLKVAGRRIPMDRRAGAIREEIAGARAARVCPVARS